MEHCISDIERLPNVEISGRVSAVLGLLMECQGITPALSVGSRCKVYGASGKQVVCEVVGFRAETALLMPFGSLEGIGPGAKVTLADADAVIHPSDAWLGRIANAMGDAIDDIGILPKGNVAYSLRGLPPPAQARTRVKGKIDLGVRSLNTFITCCRGQRLGIFSGSGVGKSILMSMLARYSKADVNVIGLIGERSREVQEFIEDDLGPEGLKRSVVIVATSSESALMRRQAAYLTMAVAEYFRDSGKQVLCLMDSVTRFAMAQREIGLSAGEPPTSKGYTPTVFAELPKLLERAGTGTAGQGAITGMFTVLVEGDDTNEPISDTVRGIVDGHIVLDRKIAERSRFPSVNVLRSVSRVMPDCNTDKENDLVQAARAAMSTYEDMAEMVRLGAYKKGTDPEVDRAIALYPKLEDFLRQRKHEQANLAQGYQELAKILGVPWP